MKPLRHRDLRIERFEDRLLLSVTSAVGGPTLLGISTDGTTNQGNTLTNGKVLNIAPQQLVFLFSEGQTIDPATVASGITITGAGPDGKFGDGVIIAPGYIGIGELPNQVVVRFSATLPTDEYQITVNGTLANTKGLFFNGGQSQSMDVYLDLAQASAVVPQPVGQDASGNLLQVAIAQPGTPVQPNTTPGQNEIDVYFNEPMDPTSVTTLGFYQLFATCGTADPTDDVSYAPTAVQYLSANNEVRLFFSQPLNNLPGLPTPAANTAVNFRLRIGEAYQQITTTAAATLNTDTSYYSASQPLPSVVQPGVSFGSATTPESLVVSGSIGYQPYSLQWPGAPSDTSHRDLPIELDTNSENHYTSWDPTDYNGIPTIIYNFPDVYGADKSGFPLHNQITQQQEILTRQIFQLFSAYFGVQVEEDPSTLLGGGTANAPTAPSAWSRATCTRWDRIPRPAASPAWVAAAWP